MAKLTEPFVAKLTVPNGARDVQIFDDVLPGFGIRAFAGGKRSYFVKYGVGGHQRKQTLGTAAPGVLAAMRRRASEVLSKARLGVDVAAERQAKQVQAEKQAATIGNLLETYLKAKKKKLRPSTLWQMEYHLKNMWLPLHGVPVDELRRAAVVTRVDEIEETSGPVSADRAKAYLCGFLNWAIQRGHADANVAASIDKRGPDGGRERVLSPDELRLIWHACPDSDYGRIVKLLLLTGQRREEIGGLRWDEMDLEVRLIRLPGERTKNRKPHDVPLCDLAVAVLESTPRIVGHETVFGDRPDTGYSGWSAAKRRLDARLPEGMKHWTIHDLRRTFVTLANELGVEPHHVEACVNHVSGHKSGIAGTYNRSVYGKPKKAAFAKWGDFIAERVA